MSFKLPESVHETSTTTGTTPLTLLGAVTDRKTFSSQLSSGDTTLVTVTNGTDTEVCIGTFTGPDQIALGRVLYSTNGGALITWVAGTRDVYIGISGDVLASLLDPTAGTGLLAQTADETWARRTITGTAGEVTVTNGNGVAGNPTLSLGFSPASKAASGANADITSLSALVTMATAVSASGQTSAPFTVIPSWARQIVVSIAAMSTSAIAPSVGTVVPMIQIGSGSYDVSGYAGSVVTLLPAGVSAGNVAANGFDLSVAWSAGSIAQGSYTLTLLDEATDLWVIEGGIGYSNTAAVSTTRGYKALSGALDRIRVVMDLTDKFDGSTIVGLSFRP